MGNPSISALATPSTSVLTLMDGEEERRALVNLVQKTELETLLGSIDGASLAAQRRHLDRAITEVRADNLPEMLRDALLRALMKRSLESTRANG